MRFATIEAANGYLEGLEPQRPVTLFFEKSAWTREHYTTPALAQARIAQVMSFRDIEVPPLTVIRRCPLEAVKWSQPTIRRALQTWCENEDVLAWAHSTAGAQG